VSKFLQTSLGLATLMGVGSFATSAQATCRIATPPPPTSCIDCSGPKTGKSTLPPLSSYFQHQARCTNNKPYVPIADPGHATSGSKTTVVQNPIVSTHINQTGNGSITVNQSPTITTAVTQSGSGTASVIQNPTVSTSINQSGNGTISVTQNPVIGTRIVQNRYRTGCTSHTCSVPRPIPYPVPRPLPHPRPRPTYYRVVHPIVRVPVPVPTPVPVCVNTPCAPQPYRTRSRYGY
jgi:hypothetical protein